MRIICVWCICLLISLPADAADAKAPIDEQAIEEPTTAQGTPQPSKPSSEQATATDSVTRTIKSKSKNKQNDDIFRPSEEISEDFAVSFPVDI